MTLELLAPGGLLALIALVAYIARGLTGAGSAVLFNALIVGLATFGYTGGLSLLDGLYHLALTEAFASGVMAFILRRGLRFDPFVLSLLAGLVPSTIVFSLLLPHVDAAMLKLPLSILILAAGLLLATGGHGATMSENVARWLAFPIGLLAGVLGGLFGMAGPVLFILVTRATPNPRLFRDRFVAIGLVTTFARVGTLVLAGVYTSTRLSWFAFTTPAVLVGVLLGLWIHERVSPAVFRIAIGGLVAVGGLTGVADSLTGVR